MVRAVPTRPKQVEGVESRCNFSTLGSHTFAEQFGVHDFEAARSVQCDPHLIRLFEEGCGRMCVWRGQRQSP